MPAERLNAVNQYLGTISDQPAPQWKALDRGTSNRIFTAQWQDRTLVVRLNGGAELAFGVDREREDALLRQLSGLAWVPVVLQNRASEGWLLMEWQGEPVSEPLADEVSAQLLAAVTEWQQLKLDDTRLNIDYAALFESFRPCVQELPMTAPLEALIDGALRALASLPDTPPTVTHHDLHPGNLCIRDGQLAVLDWEYGAVGCGWFDAAALQLHCGISSTRLAELPVLSGLSLVERDQGLKRAVWLLEVLETLWYWTRGLTGSELTMKDLMQQTIRLLKQ